MKFLCDVHIARKVAKWLEEKQCTGIHLNDILDKWFTSDTKISKYVDENDFILVTKDNDFRNSFFIRRTPRKLIKINSGNTSNEELIQLLDKNFLLIEQLNQHAIFYLELSKNYPLYFL